jgi:hypothetical protein
MSDRINVPQSEADVCNAFSLHLTDLNWHSTAPNGYWHSTTCKVHGQWLASFSAGFALRQLIRAAMCPARLLSLVSQAVTQTD